VRRRVVAADGRSGATGWQTVWTKGRDGLADWPRVARELRRRDWRGNLCLHAEYTDEDRVDELIRQDLAYPRTVYGVAEQERPEKRPGTAVERTMYG
jgi:hypothetical protein